MFVRKPLPIVVAFAALLASGCSSGANSNATTASSTPTPLVDTRTGFPVYPDAKVGPIYGDVNPTFTRYFTADTQQKVASWYKAALPAGFDEHDYPTLNPPVTNFDKQSNGKISARVQISTVAGKRMVELTRYE